MGAGASVDDETIAQIIAAMSEIEAAELLRSVEENPQEREKIVLAKTCIKSAISAYKNDTIDYIKLCTRFSNALKTMPLTYFEPTTNGGVAKYVYAHSRMFEEIQVTQKCLLCAISQHLYKKDSSLTYDEILTFLLTQFCRYLHIDLEKPLSNSDRTKLNAMIELGVTSTNPKTEEPSTYSPIVSLLIERNICLIVLVVESEGGPYNWDYTQIVGNHEHNSATQFVVIKNLRGHHFEYLPQLTTLFEW
jgi:hypothetical protein